MTDNLAKSIQKKYNMVLNGYKYCKNTSIYNEKTGGYVKYITKEGIMKGYGIYIKKYDGYILLKNVNYNKLWKISINDYFIFYKPHVSINDVKRRVMMELISKLEKRVKN